MTSGELISLFLVISVVGFVIIFTIWELVQLQRRRKGNKTAYTASQYIERQINSGSKFWKWFAVILPIFLFVTGLWLFFHWEVPCVLFGRGC